MFHATRCRRCKHGFNPAALQFNPIGHAYCPNCRGRLA